MSQRRYRITHTTTLTYSAPVVASHNEVRMTPVTEDGQATLESRLRVRPMSWSHVYRDYWGTHVTALEAQSPHESLEVESLSVVERSDVERSGAEMTWDDLHNETLTDRFYEYLVPSARTSVGEAVTQEFVAAVDGRSPREAVELVCGLAHDRVAYAKGSSSVADGAQTAWDSRLGVCQDITHVAIAGLRAIGVPARYVSGYVCPRADLAVGETAEGESHAWLEWWDGDWFGADPTNLREVGLDHVIVGRGRDYQDVPPFKGVYQGQSTSSAEVKVSFQRRG